MTDSSERIEGAGASVPQGRRARLVALDTLRGAAIVSMIAFHAMYDWVFVCGQAAPWFFDGVGRVVWRCSISWTFIFLAGWMCPFSRSNLKRSGKYALAALAVWAVTSLAGVGTPISFGILYCMAACTFVYAMLRPLLERFRSRILAIGLGLLFLVAVALMSGARVPFDGIAWLGFPGPTFSSSDYYPLLPYVLLFLAGSAMSDTVLSYPDWIGRDVCPPLTLAGRHSLLIYLAHQPLLLALFALAGTLS